jgi:hypothetical protein
MSRQQLVGLVTGVTLIALFLAGCGTAPATPAAALAATPTPEPATATPAPRPPAPTDTPKPEEPQIFEGRTAALRTGDTAPDFTLPDKDGNMVHLADELEDNQMVVLVFYEVHS